jgi:hypothetical protein
MQVTRDRPDDISAILEGRWPDLPRQALEALVVEAYRTGVLTERRCGVCSDSTRGPEVHAILKDHGVPLRYTEADFEDDLAAHRQVGILRD